MAKKALKKSIAKAKGKLGKVGRVAGLVAAPTVLAGAIEDPILAGTRLFLAGDNWQIPNVRPRLRRWLVRSRVRLWSDLDS